MARLIGRTSGILIVTAVIAMLGLACDSGSEDSPAGQLSTAATATPAGGWELLAPMGSGGFPPGSGNLPEWVPGKFPLGLPAIEAFNNELWMTSTNASWSSPDGLNWTHHEKTEWDGRLTPAMAFFDNKLWMSGGMTVPDPPCYPAYSCVQPSDFLNDIWSSADGSQWEKVGNATWPGRLGHGLAVFQDKLWLFGGANHVKPDGTADEFLNDVWSSEDTRQWTQVTAAAPWSPRDHVQVEVFNGAMYLLGGEGHADIWRTADGQNWTQLTADAGWGDRRGYGAQAFDGKLWVFGGWIGESTRNAVNDVWTSPDGVTWTRQAEHAPWGARSPINVVFQDKLWIFSGKHTGASDSWGGDIWAISADSSVSAETTAASGTPAGPVVLPAAGG